MNSSSTSPGPRAIGAAIALAAAVAADPTGGQRALAFHTDIHYLSQAVIALASDWPIDDAMWIAGADEAVDRNEPTVAGLERNTIQMKMHQAAKNYEFHCFSHSDDSALAQKDQRAQDVVAHLADLKRRATDAISLSKSSTPAERDRRRIEALVAIGVYFHCQQDSWSHSGYGTHSYGHAFDDVYPGSPDHPAKRPSKTAAALREALTTLHDFARQWQPDKPPADATLSTLIQGVTNPGLLLEQSCINQWPGYWLYQDLQKSGRLAQFTPLDRPATGACGALHLNIFKVPGKDARVVQLRPPNFPVLDISGRPKFDVGRPVLVTAGGFDHTITDASATYTSASAAGCDFQLRTTVTNQGPQATKPAKVAMAVLSGPNIIDFFGEKELPPMAAKEQQVVQLDTRISRTCPPQAAFATDVQPQTAQAEGIWGDRDARNNRRVVAATPRIAAVR